jgi:6-phosphogluconolactonase (cycloisomerase 2 family)
MKILFRVLMSLLLMLALLLLASCTGAPGCPQAGFGTSTACGPGGPGGFGNGGGGGGGGGGNGNAAPAAFVYAADTIGGTSGNSTTGTIDGYDLSTSGVSFLALKSYTAPQVPPGDAGEAMVVVNKQFVYAIFELSNPGIYGWSIDSGTGALTALANSPISASLGLPLNATGTYQMTSDPAGNFLFISSTGQNEILVFAINSTTGALTAVPGSPFSTVTMGGFEPGNIATDGLGRFLYACIDSVDGGTEFFGFTIAANGALTLIPGSPFSANAWELQGDATGHYLVATSGNAQAITGTDDKHLYVFSINQTTGAVTPVGTPVATVYSPLKIAMQPPSSNGEFVYSFSVNDTNTGINPIEGYQLDPTTGVLTAVTNSPFSNIATGQWGQFDQSGANLVVYSDVVGQNGPVATLAPFSVSSSGQLTQPISPLTLVTPGWFVVTDP